VERFCIKGKGLPDPHGGGRGDLYYHVRVLSREAESRAAQDMSSLSHVESRQQAADAIQLYDKSKTSSG